MVVDVRQEPGVDLGHPREQPLLVVGERLPAERLVQWGERLAVGPGSGRVRADRVDGRQLRVLQRDEETLWRASVSSRIAS